MRVLAVVVAIAAVAASNALIVPLRLEHQIEAHARTPTILEGLKAGQFAAVESEGGPWGLQGPLRGLEVAFRQKGCDNMELLRRCAPCVLAAACLIRLLQQCQHLFQHLLRLIAVQTQFALFEQFSDRCRGQGYTCIRCNLWSTGWKNSTLLCWRNSLIDFKIRDTPGGIIYGPRSVRAAQDVFNRLHRHI